MSFSKSEITHALTDEFNMDFALVTPIKLTKHNFT